MKELGFQESDFVQIYGGDTFEVKKPHPKPLRELIRLAGVQPHETVMIGDSKADIHAAKAAGTHAIAVSFGYNSREMLESHGAEHFIDHFDELKHKLQALKNFTAGPDSN
jgi:phosphoglycolate phosphatase